jgi:hypothetical protein
MKNLILKPFVVNFIVKKTCNKKTIAMKNEIFGSFRYVKPRFLRTPKKWKVLCVPASVQLVLCIGVPRGVSESVEDGRWLPALQAGHPPCRQATPETAWPVAGPSDTLGSPWPPLAICLCLWRHSSNSSSIHDREDYRQRMVINSYF